MAQKPSAKRNLSKMTSRPPLERMLQIHEALKLVSEGKWYKEQYPNCTSIGKELEVAPKTILRDITFMRDRLSMPIEYDELKYGYYYTEPVSNFPTVQVSEGEIVALFVAQKAMEQYRGTPFEAPLASAFQKLSEGLTDSISFTWNDFNQAISFRSAGQSFMDLKLFEAVSKAVRESDEVEFKYRKPAGKVEELRRVRPYHLGCVEHQWYIFGFDLERKAIRTFALPRIKQFKPTRKKFVRPTDFSIEKHLGESFGVFKTDKKHELVIRFDAFASQLVRERQWHKSQVIRELKDETLELKLTLDSLPEIERWILSWGTHAEVIKPAELREKLKATATGLRDIYKS